MPDHKIGSSYSLSTLLNAYHADAQTDADALFLLYRGDEILALCLRQKFNPEPHEVWVGDDPVVAEWGKKLASLKGQKTIPVYYSHRGRSFYTFMGHHLITGDTDDPLELAKRKGPVALSRVVFISQVQDRSL
jgi:hypothetical protein